MIDLTPLDVRKKRGDFRRILRGYDPEEVDSFLELVAERLEELVRLNLSLSEKTESLESQVKALEGREKAVQEALVTAQKLREDVKDQSARDAEILRDQASRAAEILKAEAENEIARRLGEVDGLVLERKRALEDLERSRLKFLKAFRGLLERELDAVEVEEARRPLDDTPLDLNLRGWKPKSLSRAEAVAPQPADRSTESEQAVTDELRDGAEPEDEPEEPDGFETQVLEVATPRAPSTSSTEAPTPAADAEEEEDGAPLIVDVESLALDVEGPMPPLDDLGPEKLEAPPAGRPMEEPDSDDESLGDPKWLFSLLKKAKGEETGG